MPNIKIKSISKTVISMINHGSLKVPKYINGTQKTKRVPTRMPIDHFPPLDFFGEKLVEVLVLCSIKEYQEIVMNLSF